MDINSAKSFFSRFIKKIALKKQKNPHDEKYKIKKIGQSIFASPKFEYLPYACHYNVDTIITKNGEMLQVIRIDYDDTIKNFDGTAMPDIRTEIRGAIKSIVEVRENINVSFYVQTVRDFLDFTYRKVFEKNFMGEVEDFWISRNSLSKEYKNSIFITVVISGVGNRFELKNYIGYLFFSVIKIRFIKHFKSACAQLNEITSSMINRLSVFSPSRLTCVKKEGVYYSELVAFFSRLSLLDGKMRPLEDKDISHYFSASKLAFGYDEFEIYNEEQNLKKLGSIIEFKAARGVGAPEIKRIFDTNAATLITEFITFGKDQKKQKGLEYEKNLLNVSEDKIISENSCIDKIVNSDYLIYNALLIMIVGRDREELYSKLMSIVSEISHYGYSIFKHNLRLEQAYWFQLPANFSFCTKKNIANYKDICSFAHISFDIDDERNHWGSPVAIFSDILGERFKFNFRYGRKSSLFVLGDQLQSNVLVNFLACSSLRSNAIIYSIDQDIRNSFFIRANGGKMMTIGFDNSTFNPFYTSKRYTQKEMHEIITMLASDYLSEEEINNLNAKISTADPSLLNYKFVFGLVEDEKSRNALLSKYEGLFSELNSDFFDRSISTHFFINPDLSLDKIEIVLNVLLKKLKFLVDKFKTKTILIIRDKGLFSKNPSFKDVLTKLISYLDERGSVLIFVPQEYVDHLEKSFVQDVIKLFNTHILFGDQLARERHSSIGFFDKYVVDRARWIYNEGKKELIMIRGKEIFNLRFDLSDIKYRKIFWSSEDDIRSIENFFASGRDPDDWLKDLYLEKI